MKRADQFMTVNAANPANPVGQQSGTSPPGNAIQRQIYNTYNNSQQERIYVMAQDKDLGKNQSTETIKKLSGKKYQKQLKSLHTELVKLQAWVLAKGLKVCVIFEGRDGAGKGGTIKALTERVSPRVFRVVALPAPTEREKTQMYVQRYFSHLPAAGEVVIFDRSWYNRAGVERVMGFCTPQQVQKFLADTPLVERAIVESGIILIKYWLEVGPDEQEKRLRARIEDGRKTWKLSEMDIQSFALWDEYTKARDEMFAATDTAWAPWFVAHSEDKKRVRLNVISHLLKQVHYEELQQEKNKLPKRKTGHYHSPELPLKIIPDIAW